jgi:hypothetical protein
MRFGQYRSEASRCSIDLDKQPGSIYLPAVYSRFSEIFSENRSACQFILNFLVRNIIKVSNFVSMGQKTVQLVKKLFKFQYTASKNRTRRSKYQRYSKPSEGTVPAQF